MMDAIRFNVILVLGTILIPLPSAPPVVAQDQGAGHCPGKLEALNASYVQQLRDIERRWIAELADLAGKSSGPGTNDAYRQLFNLAIARDLCTDAQPAARNCLKSIPEGEDIRALAVPAGEDVRALAASVQVFARAEKGEYEQSLADLEALFKEPGCVAQIAAKSHAATALAVGEAYLKRLIRDGRYDVAHRLCALACKDDAPAALKNHFAARMARLDLLDKPAPVISGTDVDGHQVSLADLKGKVVLVDFWESGCSQCVASISALDALAQKYHWRGFVILGVKFEEKHRDVKDAKTAPQTARQFLVRHSASWIDLLDCQRTDNITKAYGVEEIPANFLIGRDGRIVAVEQSGDDLERAVVRALGCLQFRDFK
jgi:peroxiredoxin